MHFADKPLYHSCHVDLARETCEAARLRDLSSTRITVYVHLSISSNHTARLSMHSEEEIGVKLDGRL
jgi:hypothetical protein